MNSKQLEELVATHLAEIGAHFLPGTEFTFLARSSTHANQAVVVSTEKDLTVAAREITRLAKELDGPEKPQGVAVN